MYFHNIYIFLMENTNQMPSYKPMVYHIDLYHHQKSGHKSGILNLMKLNYISHIQSIKSVTIISDSDISLHYVTQTLRF